MQELTEREKAFARFFYSHEWCPEEIAERILSERARQAFKDIKMQVYRFLSIEFKKQMYPVEVYGRLEDIEKEEKEDGEV